MGGDEDEGGEGEGGEGKVAGANGDARRGTQPRDGAAHGREKVGESGLAARPSPVVLSS